MRDTSGYWKIISVVCKFSINHEQDVFWWWWDCNVLHRKKSLCPRKWKSERRRKLLYPLQCHKYCHSKKALGAGKWRSRSSRLRGLQIDFQLRRPELQESERTDFPRLRPLLDSALKGQSELTRVLPHCCRGHGCCCKLQSYHSKGPRKKAGQRGLNRNLSWS